MVETGDGILTVEATQARIEEEGPLAIGETAEIGVVAEVTGEGIVTEAQPNEATNGSVSRSKAAPWYLSINSCWQTLKFSPD